MALVVTENAAFTASTQWVWRDAHDSLREHPALASIADIVFRRRIKMQSAVRYLCTAKAVSDRGLHLFATRQ